MAIYVDRLPQVRREFRLYEDRVEVAARWLSGKRYHSTVKLAGLRPGHRTFYVRNKMYRWAGWIVAIGALGLAAAVYYKLHERAIILPIVSCVVVIIGLTLLVLTRRNIEFAGFDQESGGTGLDLARSGPDAGQFEAFVKRVGKQIRARRM